MYDFQKFTSKFTWYFCLILLASSLSSIDAEACSCGPYQSRSLCQLGEEADTGQLSDFMAVVELVDSTVSGEEIRYTISILEMLGGSLPSQSVELVQFGLGWTCTQYDEFIQPGAKGVLVGKLDNGIAYPDFCTLQNTFFRMVDDTVFVPLNAVREVDQPYTLTDFRANNCINFSSSTEVLPADEAFTLSYSSQSEVLEILLFDPAIRSENLNLNLYSSNGQHLLEAKPSSPIDVSLMPPGMYAILLRDEQRAWSKAFVKPN